MEDTEMSPKVTYARLDQLLTRLRFTSMVEPMRGIRAYRHSASQTLVLLAEKPASASVQEKDLVSIRRHLSENGLLEPQAFEAWLSAA
jgi:hypothetical protein